MELLEELPNEEACREYLAELRWGGHIISPYDPDSKVYNKYKKQKLYYCKNTKKCFNVKTKTIFDNNKIGLQKWVMAIWIFTHNKEISAYRLAKEINVSKTAVLHMLWRIKSARIESFSDIERLIKNFDVNISRNEFKQVKLARKEKRLREKELNDAVTDYDSIRKQLNLKAQVVVVKIEETLNEKKTLVPLQKHHGRKSTNPTIQTEKVAELVNEGKDVYEIIRKLNLTGDVIYREVEKARKVGLIDDKQPFIGFADARKTTKKEEGKIK